MSEGGAGYTFFGRATWFIEDEVFNRQVHTLRWSVGDLQDTVDKLIKMMEMMTKQRHDDKASD